jgi:hypothetical protein
MPDQAMIHALALQLARYVDTAKCFITGLRSGGCDLGAYGLAEPYYLATKLNNLLERPLEDPNWRDTTSRNGQARPETGEAPTQGARQTGRFCPMCDRPCEDIPF